MLTAELVRAKHRDGQLSVQPLCGVSRRKAEELAERLIEVLRLHRGSELGELLEAWNLVEASPREVRLKEALKKLLLDSCTLQESAGEECVSRRMDLFRRAAELRKLGTLDVPALLREHALEHGYDAGAVEGQLFADLPDRRRIEEVSPLRASTLIDDFDKEQARALLLGAARLEVFLRASEPPWMLRHLLQKARFFGLLGVLQSQGEETRIQLDGPASALASSPRYGMAFANLFPELENLPSYRLVAHFERRGNRGAFAWQGGSGQTGEPRPLPVGSDLDGVIAGLDKAMRDEPGTVIEVAHEVLHGQRGLLLVPDLKISRGGRSVYVELLGDASRHALDARNTDWPADSRELVVCVRRKKLENSDGTTPSWFHVYNRTLVARLLAQHIDSFLR